jgi:hypothetical protein
MKSKNEQTTTNTYGWQTPPQTAQGQAYDEWARNAFTTADPTIPYTFGNMRKNLNNRFDNPFGFNYSGEAADAIKYDQNNEIDQAQGQALREDRQYRNQARGSALAVSAAQNAPQLTQTGGHTYGWQSQPIGPAIIGAVGAMGSAAITGGMSGGAS